ncbi:MAG: beta-propeller domain-containing protein [Candidatus Methanoperedens sp.]|nr:beta-propeller domain-containing protein [Candidatus Methanoperedens sp.]MCZ7371774.1 beta-propeller domain-containing protein [Candidatus Methanoperedens sp.]
MVKRMLLVGIMLFISAVVFTGCLDNKKVDVNVTKDSVIQNSNTKVLNISGFETTQGLKKFSSVQEIRDFLNTNANSQNYNTFGTVLDIRGNMAMVTPTPALMTGYINGVAIPAAPPTGGATPISKEAISVPSAGGQGTADYSKTNIQVEGVDEADFVKNDGKYIYVISQNKLVIVDAYPAEKASILSETEIPGRPKDLFINGDRLVVFTENDHQVTLYPEYEYRPIQRYTQNTSALVYDISDRTKPEQVESYDINGNYFQSRMIGDYVYFIVKDSVYYYANVVDVPAIRQGSGRIMIPDVYYFDNPEQNYVFHTIASINIRSKGINAKSFMMGYSDNLYVSSNSIYLTYNKNLPYMYYQKEQEERFYNVIVPLLPKDVQDKIRGIKDSKLNSQEKWDNISSILEENYNRMSEIEKNEYFSNIEKAVEEYEVKQAQEREKTVIQKISIDKGDIEYRAKGEVPGSLLNQFSMDESGDYFRVATTTQFWTGHGSVQYNNVYVMDGELNITGKLEEIAPDERIYSTRFIGNRLYMVTFKRMDPLFVIDLANPEKPDILGKLMIPGFSDYLHPYDENHIIGVGKETGDNEWGGVSIKGVKLSLFDVSDVNNPKQLDKYEIGTAGTDSEALRDHRAFLFDRKKNLLVIPIREVSEDRVYGKYGDYYNRQKVWQGAYVFGITPEDGFKLKGKISHLDDYEDQNYYWNSPSAVRRSLYMDDVLYTISARMILMNNLSDMSKIKGIDLPFEINKYYNYMWN